MDKIDNIIKFKKNEISESEINSLFLGLIRLIKRKAQDDIDLSLKRECAFATERCLCLEEMLKQKDKEIEKLKDINKSLNKKLNTIKTTTN